MAIIARRNPITFNRSRFSENTYMPKITGTIMAILLATVVTARPIFCVAKANKLNRMINNNPIIKAE